MDAHGEWRHDVTSRLIRTGSIQREQHTCHMQAGTNVDL